MLLSWHRWSASTVSDAKGQ